MNKRQPFIHHYKQKGIEDYFIGARSNIKDLISEYKNIDEPNLVLSENNQENLYHKDINSYDNNK